MNYNMTATTKSTKTTKVIAALENGTELTAKQISARYGVKNARALVSSLRMQGYPVYLNKRVSSFDGQTYSKYRLGTAPRSVVAAGYRAIAQGV
jgi:cell division septation protein DedD